MRLFVAIEIPEELKNKIFERAKELKAIVSGSFPKKENYHITLKFLGEVPEEKLERIIMALSEVAKEFAPFKVKISGRGVFPGFKKPRVVWIGVEESRELVDLSQKVEEALSVVGFEKEQRDFKGHITLARIKGISSKKELVSFCSKKDDIDVFTVSSFSLFQSILKPEGSVYIKLKEFKFPGKK